MDQTAQPAGQLESKVMVVAWTVDPISKVRRRDSLAKLLWLFAHPKSEDLASRGRQEVKSLHIQ